MMYEPPLMKADGGPFKCANCFYFLMAPTGHKVTESVPYCKRRGRQIGWNVVSFVCGDYGARDDERVQTRLDWKW